MYKYFSTFPTIDYPVPGTNKSISTVDLSVRHVISEELKNSPNMYYDYTVKEGERPDQIAHKYYGKAELAWLVMLSSNIFDWGYDFPLSSDAFESYLESKYGKSVFELTREVYHYIDGDGTIIDVDSYAKSKIPGKRPVTIYQFELEENERKANIRLISKRLVDTILVELSKRMDNIATARRVRAELGVSS